MDTQKNQSHESLCRAIAWAGSQVALANILKKHDDKISQPHIQKWLKSPVGVPPEHCVSIEKETPETRKQLRPNDWQKFWPELAAA
jgi:DNA-binding transcriptional regulator YdaS (Cro superfamily)